MSTLDLNSNCRPVVYVYPASEATYIGIFPEQGFQFARVAMADLIGHRTYEDWLDAREGLQMGLSMAGLDAALVSVSFSAFQQWCLQTGAPANERALDVFAGVAAATRDFAATDTIPVVGETDFATFRDIPAFAEHRDHMAWTAHRQASPSSRHAKGVPIDVANFVAWCKCVGETASEAAFDRYARLLVEHVAAELLA